MSSAAAANALPVAEFTLAAILFANKRVLDTAHRYARTREQPGLLTDFSGYGNYPRPWESSAPPASAAGSSSC